MRVRSDLLLCTALALCALTSDAHADDWLVQRHDARRTAASSGQLGIAIPATRWRSYLGGRLAGSAFFASDVDSDGQGEVVFMVGGRVVAKEADTDVVDWESPILAGANMLFGPLDLDEDGEPEVLVFRSGIPADVWVVSLRDGTVQWHLPGHVIYQFRWPRVGDLDGDGHLDMYLGTGACGNVPPGWGTPPPGIAYSFCDGAGCGFDSARELWRLAASGVGNCGDGARIADIDGDGVAELIASSGYTDVGIYDGATGAREGALSSPERLFNRSNTAITLADVEGDATPEIFAVTRIAVSGAGSQSLAVYGHDASGYARRWQVVAPDIYTDRLIFDDLASVSDLDGDGTKEVVYGIVDGSTGNPTVYVRTASDGTSRASLAGYTLAGLADFDGDGRAEIYANTSGGVVALSFDGASLSPRFTLPDVSLATQLDLEQSLVRRPVAGLALRNLDDDADLEFIARASNVGLRVFDVVADTPTLVGSFDAPVDVAVVALAFAGPITADRPELLVSTSDGFVLVLDDTLTVKNRYEGLEFSLPGMRAGGYLLGAGGPGVAALAVSPATYADAAGLYVIDSRGVFSRLDVRGAGAATPPTVLYSLPGLERPALADLDGDASTLQLAAVEGATTLVVRHATNGRDIWRRTGATSRWGATPTSRGLLMGGPIPYAAASVTKLWLETVETDAGGDFLRVQAFAGGDGTPGALSGRYSLLWGANNYGLASSADVNGDGYDDYVSSPTTPLRLSGTDLSTAGVAGGAGVQTSDPLIADLDDDGDLDVFAHGSWSASRALDLTSLASLGVGETRVNVRQYGALVTCGGRAAVASGSAVPGEIYVEQLTGGVITSLAHRVLAGGESYDLASAPAEGSAGGLSNITAVAGLESAADPALLVGSSDGYLYALDPCDLSLRWALNLRFPVGEPIVADADGDGKDDVFVSVADGFLYGITGAAYTAPDPVLDLYPGMPGGTDVDEVDSPASLAARWAAVTGATSYELAVLTPGGTALTSPAFHDVGAVTQTILHDLPLRLDGRYVIAVRALGPGGASGEATSDGVVVRDLLAPDANFSGPDAVYVADGVPGNFVLNARDNWSLGAYRVEVRDGADALVYSLGSGDFSGTGGAASLAWGGETDTGSVAPLGSYRLVAHVSDTAGHEAMVEWPVELAESRPDMPDAGMPDGGGVDSGVGSGSSGGCGCVVAGAEHGQPWLLLPLLGLLVWRLRRRRGR